MRHGRAAELRGRRTLRPVGFAVRVPIDAVGLGGHVGAVFVAGEVTVGELRRLPRRHSRVLCFVSLTGGVG